MPGVPAEITIREARVAVAGRLAALYCESAAYYAALDPDLYAVPEPSAMEPVLREQISAARPSILFAECEDDIAGFVSIEISTPSGRPSMMRPRVAAWPGIAVGAENRGRGVGTHLMAAAETLAAERGAEEVVLDCHANNTAAVGFYERLGYRVRGLILSKPGVDGGGRDASG